MKSTGYRVEPRQGLRRFADVMLVLAIAASAGNALAQGTGTPTGPASGSPLSPLAPTAPPEIIKPGVPPSEVNNPEAIFRKLDVGKRGYVTLAETKDLIGFADAFRAADSQGSGQLTLAQFKKAWAIYKAKK